MSDHMHRHLARMDRAFVRAFRTDDWASRGGKCAYCHDKLSLGQVTGDHVVPRSKGGFTTRENIKSSCQPCNKCKGSIGEQVFKKQVHRLPANPSLALMLAHIRWRLNRRTERAEKRILAFVGLA